jgi:glutamyl-tRNA synthetase
MKVRTRFAPSPTGKQHMGNIRTAVYAWLWARHNDGDFVLRIEDTDQVRKVPGAVRSIIEELEWFGIDIDEGPSGAELEAIGEWWEGAPTLAGDLGPYVQSQRLERYSQAAEVLISKGLAYRADFSEGQEGDVNAPHTIRFRIPKDRSLEVMDAVKGRIEFKSLSFENDPVLLKSDKFPTYHLACVVDDHDMQVSHVIRGDDWIATLPIHVLLYEAFGWEAPTFVHLPNVLGNDGKKLSKRHGATTSEVFREQGYLAEALLNFTVLIGWSSGGDAEIFDKSKLIELFTLAGVQKSGGIFDYAKLEWMNGVYIRGLSTEEFVRRSVPFLEEQGLREEVRPNAFLTVAPAVQERVKNLKEVVKWVGFLYRSVPFTPDLSAAFGKGMTLDVAQQFIPTLLEAWRDVDFADAEVIENVIKEGAAALDLKVGAAFGLIRIAALGSKGTPPLGLSLSALGRDEVRVRLEKVLTLQA